VQRAWNAFSITYTSERNTNWGESDDDSGWKAIDQNDEPNLKEKLSASHVRCVLLTHLIFHNCTKYSSDFSGLMLLAQNQDDPKLSLLMFLK